MITCWCDTDIPPYSCLWLKSVMNPVACQEPVMIVSRPNIDGAAAVNEDDLDLYVPDDCVDTWSSYPMRYTQRFYATNLRTWIVTNGGITVPAKTVFQADELLFGVHWMRYDETRVGGYYNAVPDDRWYYPRDDTWFLGSTSNWSVAGHSRGQLSHRVHGVIFRRIGRADEVAKCVPVIMTVHNQQVDDFLSVE